MEYCVSTLIIHIYIYMITESGVYRADLSRGFVVAVQYV